MAPAGWCPEDLEHETIQIKSFYAGMASLAKSYAPEKRWYPLSESEVFMGVIISHFGTKFGASSRGYNAQIGFRDNFAELIDISLSDFCSRCDVEDSYMLWNETLIDVKSLREALSVCNVDVTAGDDIDDKEDAAVLSGSGTDEADGIPKPEQNQHLSTSDMTNSKATVPKVLADLHDNARAVLIQLAR